MVANPAFLSWNYDELGNLIRLGKNVRTLDWSPVYDTALPSWLTLTSGNSGTATVTPEGSGVTASCLLTCGTSAAANTYISAPPIDLTKYPEVGFYVDDLVQDTDATAGMSLTFGFMNLSTTTGIGYGHQNGGNSDGSAQPLFWNGNSNKEYDFSHTTFYSGFALSQQKSYGVIYRAAEQAIYLVNAERGVMWRQTCQNPANFPSSLVLPPTIGIYNSDKVAHTLSFRRLRLELVSG